MKKNRLKFGTWVALVLTAGLCRAQDRPEDVQSLRETVRRQQQQIDVLLQRVNVLDEQLGQPRKVPGPEASPDPLNGSVLPAERPITDQVIGDYLRNHPGIGMPAGVQTGFAAGRGFFIRSVPNPDYSNWTDEGRIPFELRIRGRAQIDYYFYKVTDNLNHLTGRSYEPEVGDFSQIEAKRVRLFWEGTVFTPDLYYQLQIDGNTRGLGGTQGNRVVQTAGFANPAGIPTSTTGGGDTVDHALRLFTAFIAYDVHLGSASKGCGPDCPEGTYRYRPTLTFMVGKQQPFFGLTEILGSANAMLVDFSMADWFFDADDNNMLTAASILYRDFDDRLLTAFQITNGSESQFPNVQMDRLPGFIGGFWYDLGGTWDEQAQRWALFGNSISDLQYSIDPTVRVGGAVNIVPLDRRSIYGDLEQSRILVAPGGPGGTRLINLLNGDSGTPAGAHAVDKFNEYSLDVFAAGHYRGFSLYNEWWFRTLNHFQSTPAGGNAIIYQDGSGANALFPIRNWLFDYGTSVQAGYFLVPKKFEIVSRFSMISGTSGDINGNGRFTTVAVPGFTAPVRIVSGAFSNFHYSGETGVGFNYYFYGQLAKWSSDFSVYQGGNPAAGGASPAGYIAGVDGWLVRTQIQLAF